MLPYAHVKGNDSETIRLQLQFSMAVPGCTPKSQFSPFIANTDQNIRRAPSCAWNEFGSVKLYPEPPRYPVGLLNVEGEKALGA